MHHRPFAARGEVRLKEMFAVKPDRAGNALSIRYSGRVTPNETRLCAEEVRLALASLPPGFRLIVDLTGLEAMEVACSPLIANIMEICNAAGVAEVVRIIPDPTRDIGLQIMSLFHYSNHVYIRTYTSTAEAMKMLQTESA